MNKELKTTVLYILGLVMALSWLTGGAALAAQCAYYEAHNDHDWMQTAVYYPTCESDGYYEIKCRECGETRIVITQPALGHNWVETAASEVTCFKDGWYELTCTNCDEVLHIDQPKLEHLWVNTGAGQPSTCAEHGYTVEECSRCGTERTIPLPLADHSWGEWTVTVPATDNSEGQRTRTCQVCGATETDSFYPEGALYSGCGDTGSVKALQEMLVDLGYLSGSADGKYGPKTVNAVSGYQKDNGLREDGVAWPETIAAVTHSWEVLKGIVPADGTVCRMVGPLLTVPCGTHRGLMLSQSIMIAGAQDEADRLQAMENAAGLWRADLDGLYDRWISVHPDQTELVEAAREAFDRTLDAQEAAVEGKAFRLQIRLDALRRECMRLCAALGDKAKEGE